MCYDRFALFYPSFRFRVGSSRSSLVRTFCLAVLVHHDHLSRLTLSSRSLFPFLSHPSPPIKMSEKPRVLILGASNLIYGLPSAAQLILSSFHPLSFSAGGLNSWSRNLATYLIPESSEPKVSVSCAAFLLNIDLNPSTPSKYLRIADKFSVNPPTT